MTDFPPPAWWHPDELLRPAASALVALVLSLLTLWGNSLMVSATQSLFGGWLSADSDLATYYAVYAGGVLLPLGASVYLARRAITDSRAVAWELAVARTATVLAVIALAYTAVLLLGVLIHLS